LRWTRRFTACDWQERQARRAEKQRADIAEETPSRDASCQTACHPFHERIDVAAHISPAAQGSTSVVGV
jgi:hypothetical protein